MTKAEEWALWCKRIERLEDACSFKATDLRVEEYAREIGVRVETLHEWRRRIRGRPAQQQTQRVQPFEAPPRACANPACGCVFTPAAAAHRYCTPRCCYAASYDRYRAKHPRKMLGRPRRQEERTEQP